MFWFWLVRLGVIVYVGDYQQAGTLFRIMPRHTGTATTMNTPTQSLLNSTPLGEYLDTVITLLSLYLPSDQLCGAHALPLGTGSYAVAVLLCGP